MAELNQGLYAFGVVKDVNELTSKKSGEIWVRKVYIRAGSGDLLDFDLDPKANPPKEGDTVRLNYFDSINSFGGKTMIRRKILKDGVSVLNAIKEPIPEKKLANVKV
jgi:hypothetical protein